MKNKIDLVEQARQLRLQAEALEKKVERELARGTRQNVKPPSNLIVKPARGRWWTGDDGTTEELMGVIQAMISERPRRFVELLEETGARDNRIKGVLMRLQREGVNVVDVAPQGSMKALWFIPSPEVLARLKRSAARRAR